jgi:PhnB protein
MITVNPYLNFDGNTEEAFNFYKSVFGGEFQSFMKLGEVPGFQVPPEEANLVMHVTLPIGKSGSVLMGSDRQKVHGPGKIGDNYFIAVHPDTEEEAKRIFDGLSAGGKVTMPMEKTFWSALFGMCIDKFGTQWMVNCT